MTVETVEMKTFRGDLFEIVVESDESSGFFEITATEIETGQRSFVTNLNFIISSILMPILSPNEDVDDITDGESHVYVPCVELHRKLVAHAVESFEDSEWFLHHLEPALSEDFAIGSADEDEDWDDDDEDDEDWDDEDDEDDEDWDWDEEDDEDDEDWDWDEEEDEEDF